MAKVFYGIQHREKRILQDGMCLYGRGLSTLSNVLSKANCIVTTEMVVSVLSLCVGESIMPSSNSSWTVHILGLERLFALRGPSFAVEGTVLDLVMLETCRPVMILGAFFTRKPSVMGQPEWKALAKPQESDRTTHLFQSSTKEDDMSFLMEILAEIPALFQLCDNCIQTAEPRQPSSATIGMIWSRAKQLQQELHAWKEKWHSVHLSEVYETLSTTAVNLYQSTAWTTIFYFSSVEVANTFIMYHPVVSLLTSIPTSLLKAGLGLQCSGPTSCISAEQSLPDVKVSVQNICRSIEYYLHFLQASQAPPDFFLFFPLHVARRTAKQLGYSSELAWLDDVYEVARLQFPLGICANKDFGDRFNGSGEGLFG
ncbi:hypothetical protein MMC13_000259 [Lambiella insularis]|nr:hypothetical protein [Lambiella insularis]